MMITTVDQLVELLKSERVKFHVDETGWIRTNKRRDREGDPCCPLLAAVPRHTSFGNWCSLRVAHHVLMMPKELALDIFIAADNEPDQKPEVRAKLLELVA